MPKRPESMSCWQSPVQLTSSKWFCMGVPDRSTLRLQARLSSACSQQAVQRQFEYHNGAACAQVAMQSLFGVRYTRREGAFVTVGKRSTRCGARSCVEYRFAAACWDLHMSRHPADLVGQRILVLEAVSLITDQKVA